MTVNEIIQKRMFVDQFRGDDEKLNIVLLLFGQKAKSRNFGKCAAAQKENQYHTRCIRTGYFAAEWASTAARRLATGLEFFEFRSRHRRKNIVEFIPARRPQRLLDDANRQRRIECVHVANVSGRYIRSIVNGEPHGLQK